MAVPWRSTGARAVGTGALSMTVASNFPSGWAAGDLLILVVETENQNAGATPTSASPSTGTWTEIGTHQGVGTAGAAGATGLQVYWKIAEASEGTITVPDSGVYTMGWVMAYGPSPNTSSPIEGTPVGGTEATSDTSGSATQMTTGFADETVVVVVSNAVDSTTAQYQAGFTNANLTGLATRINQNSQTQNGGGCGSCDGVKATAGATGATTWTQQAASAKCFQTFALRNPAAAVNQQAGYAEGTGDAEDATASVQDGVTETVTSADTVSVQVVYIPAAGVTATAGSADGAGDAQAAGVTASGTSSPAQAGGAGEAPNAGVTASGTVAPDAAGATGFAYDAVAVTGSGTLVSAGSADGAGFAYDAAAVTGSVTSVDTVSVAVIYTAPPAIIPAAATGTGQAFNAQAGVLAVVTPEAATGTGEVPFETGFSASMSVIADDAVNAEGEALNASPVTGAGFTQQAPVAEGAGSAGQAAVTASGKATPVQAQGAGEALNPGTSTAGQTYAQPAEAGGTGQALGPQLQLSMTAAATSADGAGDAPAPGLSLSAAVAPAEAAGAGEAANAAPTTASLKYVQPAAAEGTGQAPDPGVNGSGKAQPGAADGAGQALNAVTLTARFASPATAGGTGQANDPSLTISCTVLPDVASAAGSAPDASNGVVFGVLVDVTVADGPTRLFPRVAVAAARFSVTVRPSTAGPVAVTARSSALVIRVTAAAGGRLGLAVAASREEPVSAATTRPSVLAGTTTAERKE